MLVKANRPGDVQLDRNPRLTCLIKLASGTDSIQNRRGVAGLNQYHHNTSGAHKLKAEKGVMGFVPLPLSIIDNGCTGCPRIPGRIKHCIRSVLVHEHHNQFELHNLSKIVWPANNHSTTKNYQARAITDCADLAQLTLRTTIRSPSFT